MRQKTWESQAEKLAQKAQALAPGFAALGEAKLKEEIFRISQSLRAKARAKSWRALMAASHEKESAELWGALSACAQKTTGQSARVGQIKTALALCAGAIAHMETGEGKTLAALLAAGAAGLMGWPVKIATSNGYLAERDWRFGQSFCALSGLSAGCSLEEMSASEKKAQHEKNILWVSGPELGFDYLRSMSARDKESGCFWRPQEAVCWVDEADNLMLDDARLPLVLSSVGACADAQALTRCRNAVLDLSEENLERGEEGKTQGFSQSGWDHCEKALGEGDLFAQGGQEPWANRLLAAASAEFDMRQGRDYEILHGEVVLIDARRGRLMRGRRWQWGLHQALEAKEGIPPQEEPSAVSLISIQALWKSFGHLGGLSGSAGQSSGAFKKAYGLNVVWIERSELLARQDKKDALFASEEARDEWISQTASERSALGQPVLVFCKDGNKASALQGKMKPGARLLVAKAHEREAEIISRAGEPGAITLSSAMAGRGVDVRLGGQMGEEAQKTCLRSGGLLALGQEHFDLEREDWQARGRSGRQGNPGESRFALSLDDPLLVDFPKTAKERLRSGLDGEEPRGALFWASVAAARGWARQKQKNKEGQEEMARDWAALSDGALAPIRDALFSLRLELMEKPKEALEVAKLWALEEMRMELESEEEAEGFSRSRARLMRRFGWDSLDCANGEEALNRAWFELSQRASAGGEAEIKRVKSAVFDALDGIWQGLLADWPSLEDNAALSGYAQGNPRWVLSRLARSRFLQLRTQERGAALRIIFAKGEGGC